MASCVRVQAADEPRAEATVQYVQGLTVQVIRAGATTGDPIQANAVLRAGDTLRTGEHSEAGLLLSDGTILSVREMATVEIQRADASVMVNLVQGILSFFHRDRPGSFRVRRGTTVAIVRGTEFVFAAAPDDGVVMTLFDGEVVFPDQQGGDYTVQALPGAPVRVTVVPGQPPHQTAVLASEAIEAIQWLLYYPGVLDLRDLQLSAESRSALSESMKLYEQGDLIGALRKYPPERPAADADEVLFHAAILLSVGDVPSALQLLSTLPREDRIQRLADALRQLIAAVQLRACTDDPGRTNLLTTEWMSRSYCLQSGAKLEEAREAARAATVSSPDFGFAWARLAELDFSFGDLRAVEKALARAQVLSPRNAQVFVLNGFLLAARRESRKAEEQFNRAIALDPGLGNAWLGRGLMRIREGDRVGGRRDLAMATALEPQRAAFRNYLGKAYSAERNGTQALHELELARKADPVDPTSWLYKALELDAQNRVNEAIRELEEAQNLTGTRNLYRSPALLAQDLSIASVSLARLYRDAGLSEWSLSQAVRAVDASYENFSAHLFLADSYQLMRDPNLTNLRLESAAFSEYLIANLFAPGGVRIFSPAMSQQEYAQLFEQHRIGGSTATDFSNQGAWQETAQVFGTFDKSSFAVEAFYGSSAGYRPNNDQDIRQFSALWRQQVTESDTLFAQVYSLYRDGGDLRQIGNPTNFNTYFHFEERQNPDVALGYRHEWSVGNNTLFLYSHARDLVSVTNVARVPLVSRQDMRPPLTLPSPFGLDLDRSLNLNNVELQQVATLGVWSIIAGGRVQFGSGSADSLLFPTEVFPIPDEGLGIPDSVPSSVDGSLGRQTAYTYLYWTPRHWLTMVGGLAFDHLNYPQSLDYPPYSGEQTSIHHWSPKAGVVLTPSDLTTFRAAYTESLNGSDLDQSYRIEPPQIAGFVQTFRNVVPESLLGATPGAVVQDAAIAWEQRLNHGTYMGALGQILWSDSTRTDGSFDIDFLSGDPPQPSTFERQLSFRERRVGAYIQQLLGDSWSVGVRYLCTEGELDAPSPDIPQLNTENRGLLNQVGMFAIFNLRGGFFAQAEALWNDQHGTTDEVSFDGDTGEIFAVPGSFAETFWQFNFMVGYRFARRQGEVALGILNATGSDYNLNPVTSYMDLPHQRALVGRFRIQF
ncbi:MAG: FecR domain-containing protein [Verrucomicrobiales bacterium]|nr:FecR domain-containing protein [Verrucomicrobiales bacterium]